MQKTRKRKQLGGKPGRYRFFLNPYSDARFTRCPQCGNQTKQRKLPLVVHIDPMQLLAINKTCRYCPYCDLLIAHKNDLERFLADMLPQFRPELVGNDYLVMGTADKKDIEFAHGRENSVEQALAALHAFKEVVIFKPAPSWGRY